MRKLKPHQKAALDYAKPRSGIALIMQMRTGKTLVAIRWAKLKRKGGRVLIVSPLTTLSVWERELRAEGVRASILPRPRAKKLEALEAGGKWVLTNPEGLRGCPEVLAADWSVIVLDETGGWFRKPTSKISKLILKRGIDIPNRAILTGIADPSGPEDWFCQMAFVGGGSFMGCRRFWDWRVRFMRPAYYGWEAPLKTRHRIRKETGKLCFKLTAKRAKLHFRKRYVRAVVELPEDFRKLYKEAKKDFTLGPLETKTAPTVLGWLAMLSGGIVPRDYGSETRNHKTKALLRILKNEKGPFVVWANYVRELELIQKALKQSKISSEVIFGKTSRVKRSEILGRFAAGRFSVLVLQCRVGQYGLNLSNASSMVFYSNPFDWGIRGQAEKRADHITKSKPTKIFDIVTRRTVDEKILRVLRGKKKSSAYFMKTLETELG